MITTAKLLNVLPLVFASLVLLVLGYIVHRRGPQGVIHGVIDWSRISEVGRHAAGRFVGTLLYLTALSVFVAAVGMAWTNTAQASTWIGVGLSAAVIGLTLVMILGLLRYPGRYPSQTVERHERR